MPRSRRCTPAMVMAGVLVALLGAASTHPARAATTLIVTTTADLAPPCQPSAFSLRCVIAQANADGAGDTIAFHIPAATAGCAGMPAVCTIRSTNALTLTAGSTTINGYSQPGARPNTNPLAAGDNAVLTIRLDGSGAGQGVNGINAVGAHDTIEGLSITGFQTCFVCPRQIPGAQEGGSGVEIRGSGDVVAGNFLGVLPDGTTAGPNQFAGVTIINREPFAQLSPGSMGPTVGNATIGGTTPAASNVLSGNSDCVVGTCEGSGVFVFPGSGSVIERNYIGTTASGTSPLTNSATGAVIAAPNNSLGSTTGAGNVIAHNSASGVLVGTAATDTGTHSAIQRNAIFANGGLGIDLAPQGVVNCTTSPPGPNDETPCPVITTATTTMVSGTACAGCAVEVYIASNEADDQGHGEGQTFLGSTIAGTGGAWSLPLASGQAAAGQQVTASATTAVAFQVPAETSEFAANVTVGP